MTSIFPATAKLEIRSAGFKGEITIKAKIVQKYLAMDSTGNVTLVVSKPIFLKEKDP